MPGKYADYLNTVGWGVIEPLQYDITDQELDTTPDPKETDDD